MHGISLSRLTPLAKPKRSWGLPDYTVGFHLLDFRLDDFLAFASHARGSVSVRNSGRIERELHFKEVGSIGIAWIRGESGYPASQQAADSGSLLRREATARVDFS